MKIDFIYTKTTCVFLIVPSVILARNGRVYGISLDWGPFSVGLTFSRT